MLTELYELSEKAAGDEDSREIRQGILAVFRTLNAMLCAGDFAGVDSVTAEADVERLDPNIALGFLAITMCARDRLDKDIRRAFHQRAIKRFRDRGRTDAYADKLLARYL